LWAVVLLTVQAILAGLLEMASPRRVRVEDRRHRPFGAVTRVELMTAGVWLAFIGIVLAWIVTVLGSLWGRAQSRGRARTLGLAT